MLAHFLAFFPDADSVRRFSQTAATAGAAGAGAALWASVRSDLVGAGYADLLVAAESGGESSAVPPTSPAASFSPGIVGGVSAAAGAVVLVVVAALVVLHSRKASPPASRSPSPAPDKDAACPVPDEQGKNDVQASLADVTVIES